MLQLSGHFSIEEATTTSHRDINNTVTAAELIAKLTKCATKLEKVRALLAKPIHINSWYRCLELNRAIGSKDTSDHIKGQAVDFICPAYGTPNQIAIYLRDNKELIGFKQLILEHTWVHISWELEIPNLLPKYEVLSLLAGGKYAIGLTDSEGNKIA